MEAAEILQTVKKELRDRLLRVQVGWESLFATSPEAIMITSADLQYTYVPKFLAIVEQIVIISRFKVALVVKASEGTKGLLEFLTSYNFEFPRNQVKKVLVATVRSWRTYSSRGRLSASKGDSVTCLLQALGTSTGSWKELRPSASREK